MDSREAGLSIDHSENGVQAEGIHGGQLDGAVAFLGYPLAPVFVSDVVDEFGGESEVDDSTVFSEGWFDFERGSEVSGFKFGGGGLGNEFESLRSVAGLGHFQLIRELVGFPFRRVGELGDGFGGGSLAWSGDDTGGFEDGGLVLHDEFGAGVTKVLIIGPSPWFGHEIGELLVGHFDELDLNSDLFREVDDLREAIEFRGGVL